ncbi:MAG: preprotein translocase subunit SecG [Opitutales bacterium]|nr:preprotein translocase subunit SecG [Opitutales bacterium]
MLSLLIGIFTFVLILICVLLVLVILMQRPSADAGMGASLAGGAAESAFGGETGNVLTRVCVKCIVIFFVLTFSLYLANLYLNKTEESPSEGNAVKMEEVVKNAGGEASAPAQEKKQEAANAADSAKADAAKAAEGAKQDAQKKAEDAAASGKNAAETPAQQAK